MGKWIVGIIMVVGVILAGYWVILQTGETPSSPTPSPTPAMGTPTPSIPSDVMDHMESKQNLIRVTTPSPLTVVTSPLTVQGEARGTWFFEATFPIVMVDWDGRIIAESFATAEGEWMTEEFVPFTATIEFEAPEAQEDFMKRGSIILQRSNPSGLPENDDALEIPIYFE